MRLTGFATLTCLLVLPFLPFCVLAEEPPAPLRETSAQIQESSQDSAQESSPQADEDNTPPPGGDFTLQSSTGPVSLKDLRGKVVLLFFGYTSCPDVCPLDLRIMADALEAMSDETRARVQGIFVSVDPERDTPEKLADYSAFFHPKIIGLTADEKTLREVATRYGVQYYRVDLKEAGLPYAVNHSAATYLIDPEGTLRFIFPHNTQARVLVKASDYTLDQFQHAEGAEPKK